MLKGWRVYQYERAYGQFELTVGVSKIGNVWGALSLRIDDRSDDFVSKWATHLVHGETAEDCMGQLESLAVKLGDVQPIIALVRVLSVCMRFGVSELAANVCDVDDPQTEAERNLDFARQELAEFHDGHRRGWSSEERSEAHRLERNLNAALTAVGEPDAT